MPHNHRMQKISGPHLNENRTWGSSWTVDPGTAEDAPKPFGRGRSDLTRLSNLISDQLDSEHGSVFHPDFSNAVYARLSNYRSSRNAANEDKDALYSYDMDTAKEIGKRFRNRNKY